MSVRGSGGQADRAGLMSRIRGALRRGLDASFRHELAWAAGGTLVLALLLARSPLGVHYGELSTGEPAPRDIVVPVDVEIPDLARTAELREAARRQVPPSYVFDSQAAERKVAALSAAFQVGRRLVESSGTAAATGASDAALRAAVLATLPPGTDVEFVEVCRRNGFSVELERRLKAALRSLLGSMVVYRRDILPEDRPVSVRDLGQERGVPLRDFSQIEGLDAAKERARELAAALPGLEEADSLTVANLLERMTEATLTFDQQETSRRMDEAARRVPALFARIERGTVLARKGSLLTADVVEQARAVEKARPKRLEPASLAGTVVLAAMLVTFLWRYSRRRQGMGREPTEHPFSMLVLLLVVMLATSRALLSITVLLMDRLSAPFDRPETMLYLIPASAGALLAALLFSGRAAMVYSVFFSLPYAMLAGWDLRVLTFSLITHFAAIYAASQYRSRIAPLKAGLVVGIAGAAAAAALDLAMGAPSGWIDVAADCIAAFLGGAVGVSLLASFLLPIFEGVFGILTDVRLLELSNLNNPLLSQLAASAPGSYNHSLIVGTLAEAAAEAIGANGLFCRVAAFYHDIGKMKMPEYYIENQRSSENPHNRLVPSMSALVIASHVKDGARLGRDHGLPQQILDVIPQHHGTRVMTYFYEKAKKAAEETGARVDREDYRYPGPKPQTREAAIFMLADSVEAAARTIDEPDPDKFRSMIRKIAGRIVLDGQFDECDLTFRDLDAIVESFVRSLVAIYHRRVDYPTYVFERERRARKEGARAARDEAGPQGQETKPPGPKEVRR